MKSLEGDLRAIRESGRKALVPYFVAGLTKDWVRYVETAVHAGADAVEIGIPFSDPMMDGVVIQEGARRALLEGTTFDSVCDDLASIDVSAPLIAMTYFNIFHHYGLERAAGRLQSCAIRGAIIPDLALEEAEEWRHACDDHDVATIFLAAPSTSAARAGELALASEGFAYASARMAVTGRAADAGRAHQVVERLRAASDLPVYVGIGISTPEQARDAVGFSDGAIVGSALVKLILEGASVHDVHLAVEGFRSAIDL